MTESSPRAEVILKGTGDKEEEVDDISGLKPHYMEDDIRRSQMMDIVSLISGMRLTFSDQSRLKIPLCRMIPMPMV